MHQITELENKRNNSNQFVSIRYPEKIGTRKKDNIPKKLEFVHEKLWDKTYGRNNGF